MHSEGTPKVSVIIPAYNVEASIGRCIESIIKQTYCDIEIIVIDDFSKDKTPEVIANYERRDNRIQAYYHQENKGPSYSRNEGMRKSHGEYLLFVDADDYVLENYVEALYFAIKEEKVSISICRIADVYPPFSKVVERSYGSISGILRKDFIQLEHSLYGPVVKMFEKKVLEKHKISFPSNGKYGEDEYFTLLYLKHVNRYAFVNQSLYVYVHRFNGSLSSIHSKENFLFYVDKLEHEMHVLKQMDVSNRIEMISKHVNFLLRSYAYMGRGDTYIAFRNRVQYVLSRTCVVKEDLHIRSIRALYVYGIVKYIIRKAVYEIPFVKFLYAFYKTLGGKE